jgi:hypothetical protein
VGRLKRLEKEEVQGKKQKRGKNMNLIYREGNEVVHSINIQGVPHVS